MEGGGGQAGDAVDQQDAVGRFARGPHQRIGGGIRLPPAILIGLRREGVITADGPTGRRRAPERSYVGHDAEMRELYGTGKPRSNPALWRWTVRATPGSARADRR